MLTPRLPENEVQRLEAVRGTRLLFTAPEERFDRATRLASRLFEVPIALVTLLGETRLWLKSALGLETNEMSRDISFCGHAILGEETFVVEDAGKDPRFADNPLVTGQPNVKFYAGRALRTADGSRVGTFCVMDHRPRSLTPEQLETLQDLSALVEAELQRGEAIESRRELLRERDELKRRVSIDELTNLWNRAAIMELLHAEMGRARRGSPVAVAMIDADHFKSINDTYGHGVGDTVLAEVAARIRHAVREFDFAGRYGGEEFIAVFSNCGLEDARMVCERIRSNVANEHIATHAGTLSATVSIGFASLDDESDSPGSVIGAADRAMYRAKAKGRNRVECAREDDDMKG